jgi:DNA (cytosine-5)-methyltransferase 1
MTGDLTVLEICAGAGGQSLGLEASGFTHLSAVEIDANACGRVFRRGFSIQQGEKVLVVDDIVTTGDCRMCAAGDVPEAHRGAASTA